MSSPLYPGPRERSPAQRSSEQSSPEQRYDEICGGVVGTAPARVLPHWQPLLGALAATSPAQLGERIEFAHRRIRENGITYNVYADPKGVDRPWALDIVPFILPASEWSGIAAAINQRATLLDRVLADLYGPQQLLEEGVLPPALVYGHNGFLWPCRGIEPPGGRFLHIYAADLARSPDGQWWVIADRTQAPSGAGYALENRQIVSRLFPDLFRDQQVQQLAPWFRAVQDTLTRHAPVDPGETPSVVLLTPGPHNETYFEHVYLARYLGLPLVEGQDLTVRGATLYLKTLGGLQRVHAVLRRQDDDFCDPLDLRQDSTLGVPGLVGVARAGRVLIANALGSGVLESPGLTGFLPALCERLLHEPLQMPSVASWWCGEPPALEHVIEHLDHLVLKPAYPSQRMEPVFGNRLSAEEREQWVRRLRARPTAYVAQELVQLSQAPVITSDLSTGALGSGGDAPALQPRTIGLRVYAVAGPDGYQVLPGALTRVAGETSVEVLSMQRGGSSKDTWVLADVAAKGSARGPARDSGSRDASRDLARDSGPAPARAAPSLSSRSVENLFWLGRYSERVEYAARLLRLTMLRLLEDGVANDGALPLLVSLCETAGVLPSGQQQDQQQGPHGQSQHQSQHQGPRIDQRLLGAVFDEQWYGSLLSLIRRTTWAAMHVRERLSVDHWQALSRLQEAASRSKSTRPQPRLDHALALLDRVLLACTALVGYAMDDMVRDAGWRFLVIGRRIERLQGLATATNRFLAAEEAGSGFAPGVIDCLLELADSTDTWRQRYLRAPGLTPALDIVVFDADNPHSLAFQAGELQRYLERLGIEQGELPDRELRDALDALRAFDLSTLAGADAGAARLELSAQVHALWLGSAVLSDRIGNRYFSHVADTAAQLLAV